MMAGVTIGIASPIILTWIGESTRLETLKRFKNMLGTFDTIIIRPGSSKNRGMVSLTNVEPSLKFDDATAIASQILEIRQVAQIQNALDIDVKYEDRSGTPAIFGVSPNWPELRGDQVPEGDPVSTVSGTDCGLTKAITTGVASHHKACTAPNMVTGFGEI